MKKHLIAAAVAAAVAVPAAAQVTVYGVMDLGYGSKEYSNNNYQAASKGETSGVLGGQLSSSRLGFRGTEDLGGGLKANFVLELGFRSSGTQLDTDAGKERTATVGLQGGFGKLDLGWSKTASQLIMERYTAGGANNFVGEAFNFKDETDFGGTNPSKAWQRPVDEFTDDRATGFHYVSPAFSGVTVGLTYANSDSKDQDGTLSANAKTTIQDISAVYTGFPGLDVGVSLGKEKSRAAAASSDAEAEVLQYGAKYTIGQITVFGQYVDSESKAATGLQDRAMDGAQFGIQFKAGNITLHAQMADLDEEGAAGVASHERKSHQLGAQYAMSKRTTVYGLMGKSSSETVAGVKNEVDGFVAGIRHTF
jgi:predicted porin